MLLVSMLRHPPYFLYKSLMPALRSTIGLSLASMIDVATQALPANKYCQDPQHKNTRASYSLIDTLWIIFAHFKFYGDDIPSQRKQSLPIL